MVERPGGKLLGLARVVERGRVEKITEQNPELLFGGDGGSRGEWREGSGCPERSIESRSSWPLSGGLCLAGQLIN